MLDNIMAHSIVVAKAAQLISRNLRDAGSVISMKKIVAGALIHDIGKTSSLTSNMDHSEIGRQICLENHLDEIAQIVGEHVRLKGFDPNGDCTEKEIVFYADKRVNHDKVVNLKERLEYILGRYGKNREDICNRIIKNFRLCAQVEKKLFNNISFSPEALSDLVKQEKIPYTQFFLKDIAHV